MGFSFCFYLVEKVANESQKTPRDVVMMENFHHIFATLSRLKISCLEAEKKEAKQKYTDHLQSYVIYSLGQPLEKLNVRIFSLSVFFLVLNTYVYVYIWKARQTLILSVLLCGCRRLRREGLHHWSCQDTARCSYCMYCFLSFWQTVMWGMVVYPYFKMKKLKVNKFAWSYNLQVAKWEDEP